MKKTTKRSWTAYNRNIDKLYLPIGTKLFLVEPILNPSKKDIKANYACYTDNGKKQKIFAIYRGNKQIQDCFGLSGRVSKVAYQNLPKYTD